MDNYLPAHERSVLDVSNEGMPEFTAIFENALSRISVEYFQIRIDGGDPVYRERVYCYELYHQLRCLWPPTSPYRLNGELDKAAHPILKKLGADRAKPDLLVHQPGYMKGNYAIVEVKRAAVKCSDIRSDLVKLSLFRDRVGYPRAIFLLFGYEAESTANRVMTIANQMSDVKSIELWIHNAPGKCPRHQPLMDCHGLQSGEIPTC